MTSALGTNGSTRAWRKIRAGYELALEQAGSVPCAICGTTLRPGDRWVLGHVHDRALGGNDDALQYECQRCSSTGGAHLGNDIKAAARELVAQGRRSSGAGGDPKHAGLSASLSPAVGAAERSFVTDGFPVFDPASLAGVAWLADLLDKPDDAAWPRHMSPVHPEAVCSFGWEGCDHLPDGAQPLEPWMEEQHNVTMRWWQKLAGRMQLQHRADGSLCIEEIVESGPRRIGKSVRLRSNALWRMRFGQLLFGEVQLVMHTGRDLPIVREIQQKAWRWAEEVAGWAVTKGNGKEAMETESADRWLARSMNAVYGYDVTLGMVDEGWDVTPAAVDEGLEPAAMERLSPQIVKTSTAHRRATPLMPRAISSALTGMGEEFGTLLLLWAADPHADPGAESTWRSASPHWSESRRRMIALKYEKALRGEADPDANDPDPIEGFRAQYLNIWPSKGVRAPGDPVVDGPGWAARGTYEPGDGPRVIAVEAWFGAGVALAVAEALASGRVGVTVEDFSTAAEAAERAVELMNDEEAGPVYAFLAGKSLTRDPDFEAAEPVQGRARQTIEDLARLLTEGALVHDGSELLTEQALELRVKAGAADGLQVVSKGRIDGVKAAVWAALRARELASAEPDIY